MSMEGLHSMTDDKRRTRNGYGRVMLVKKPDRARSTESRLAAVILFADAAAQPAHAPVRRWSPSEIALHR
jgi:hypothetical protein